MAGYPKLEGFFGARGEWFDAILKGRQTCPGRDKHLYARSLGAAYVATDVISSATGAATETAEKWGRF